MLGDIERSASDISISARPLSAKNQQHQWNKSDASNSDTHLLTMDDTSNQLLLYGEGQHSRNHQLVVNETIEDVTSNNFTATSFDTTN